MDRTIFSRPDRKQKKIRITGIILTLLISVISLTAQTESVFLTKQAVITADSIKIRSAGCMRLRPRVGLVLSGGGARGIAHIGVLKAFEETRMPVDLIVGTSIGSVAGGLYAAGYNAAELQHILTTIDWPAIFQDETQRSSLFESQKTQADRYLLTVRFNHYNQPYLPMAISPGQKILNIFNDLFNKALYSGNPHFDQLRIPFRAVCTDLSSGKRVVLESGDLAESVQASMAVPLLFSPVERDGWHLVDGGLRSNLPTDVAKNLGMDVVVAVDITSELMSLPELNRPWKIADQVTTIMQQSINADLGKNAEILIRPELPHISNDDFSMADSLIKIGYREGLAVIPQLKQMLSAKRDSSSRAFCLNSIVVCGADSLVNQLIEKRLRAAGALPKSRFSALLDSLVESNNIFRADFTTDESSATALLSLEMLSPIQEIRVSGNTILSQDTLFSILNLIPGEIHSLQRFDQAKTRLLRFYRDRGYALMKITKMDWDNRSGSLTLAIDEGRIDEIRISGNKSTREYVIMREFLSRTGDLYNWKLIRRSIDNIYATQLYERVQVSAASENGRNIVQIKITEKSPFLLHLGGKVDNDRRAQGYVEYGNENFYGTGMKLTSLNRIGVNDGYLSLQIRDDRILFTPITFTLNGYYRWEQNPYHNEKLRGRYREERSGLRLTAGLQVRRLGQLAVEFRAEHIIDHQVDGEFDNQLDTEIHTIVVHSLTDKRDRIDFPTQGILNHWSFEFGNEILLGSPQSYNKAEINLEAYYTLLKRNTIHIRMLAGISDRTIPFSEKFRIGGLESFYGYEMNELFGEQVFISSLEYRWKAPFKILFPTYLSARYDFGRMWSEPSLIFDPQDFNYGYGFNLGLDTFAGPFYLGWGQSGNGQARTYVSLGFNF